MNRPPWVTLPYLFYVDSRLYPESWHPTEERGSLSDGRLTRSVQGFGHFHILFQLCKRQRVFPSKKINQLSPMGTGTPQIMAGKPEISCHVFAYRHWNCEYKVCASEHICIRGGAECERGGGGSFVQPAHRF